MRTKWDLPDGLLEEAQTLLGFDSGAEAIAAGLRELIRQHRIEDLKSLMGKIEIDIDIPASRRRPPE